MLLLTCQRAITHPCAGGTVVSRSGCFYHVFESFLKSSSCIAVATEGLMLFEVFQILTGLNLGSVEHDQVTLKWTEVQQLSSFWINSCWRGRFSWISFKPHKFAHGWEARREFVFQRPWCVVFPDASCGISFLLPFQCSRFCPWQQLGSSVSGQEKQAWSPSECSIQRGGKERRCRSDSLFCPHWPKYKDGQARR